VEWKLNERLDIAPNEVINVPESREVKLQRIADTGFQRIFQAHPGFLSKVEQWCGQAGTNETVEYTNVGPDGQNGCQVPLSSRHAAMIRRLRTAQKTEAQYEQFKHEIQPTLVTVKVVEYLAKWTHVIRLLRTRFFPY
jgi:hypothetical protein